jgi:hypothetical protein
VRLTSGVALEDILSKRIRYEDAFKEQCQEWIIKPCKQLALVKKDNTNFGMAIWLILLSFFEAHGQYLSGKSSDGQSSVFFQNGFNAFKGYLVEKYPQINLNQMDTAELYKFVRCGLFHSGVMHKKFLIDCAGVAQQSFEPNTLHSGWLINPWLLIDDLEEYVNHYLNQISQNMDMENNFKKTFERLVVDPMKAIVGYSSS